MADTSKFTNGPSPYVSDAYDPNHLPDFDTEFISQDDLCAFIKALDAPDTTPVTALNDWRPVHQRVKRKTQRSKKKLPKRSKDETREGFVHSLLKWPLLATVFGWILLLAALYLLTRFYIWAYEHAVTWRGHRERLRQNLRSKSDYKSWIAAAETLDRHLGNEHWKTIDDYAYYDHSTVSQVTKQLRSKREIAAAAVTAAKNDSEHGTWQQQQQQHALEELKNLVEACVRDNFAGTENPRLYSESYYGTKHLVQDFTDELEKSLSFLLKSSELPHGDKFALAKHLHANLGRTALCLSGGAAFAFYHLGVVKALLDTALLPDVITGTSGGACKPFCVSLVVNPSTLSHSAL